MRYSIRAMVASDWEKVAKIFRQGMDTDLARFEHVLPTYEEFKQSHLQNMQFVCLEKEAVVGWATLSATSTRAVYSGVTELSIYVENAWKSQGVGSALLQYISQKAEENGIWCIQSCIMRNNATSIAFHEKHGFRMIGYREKVAKDRYGVWRDTVLMEKRNAIR